MKMFSSFKLSLLIILTSFLGISSLNAEYQSEVQKLSSREKLQYIACTLFVGVPPQHCQPIFKEDSLLQNDIDELVNRCNNAIMLSAFARWISGSNPYSMEELYTILLKEIDGVIYDKGMLYLKQHHRIENAVSERILSSILTEIQLTKGRYPTYSECAGLAVFGGRLGKSLRRELSAKVHHNTYAQTLPTYPSYPAYTPPTPSAPPAPAYNPYAPAVPVYTSSECEICFESFSASLQPVLLPCGHQVYCTGCLSDWLKEGKSTCPKCRFSMSKETLQQCIYQALNNQISTHKRYASY